MKKSWDDPKLIVLNRATPDEAILDLMGCHQAGPGYGTGQDMAKGGCLDSDATTDPCSSLCESLQPS